MNQAAAEKRDKKYDEESAPMVGEGFEGTKFDYPGKGNRPVTEMAAVYTNITESKEGDWVPESFGTTGFQVSTDVGDEGTVTFVGGNETRASRIGGSILPAEPDMGITTTESHDSTGAGVPGTFYGVGGVYRCESAECTVERKGDVVRFTGFKFDPDSKTPMAQHVTPDMAYTLFGYWMKSARLRDNADGNPVHEVMVAAFHDGMGARGGNNLADVEGTAKYYGAAAGVYVKNEGEGDSLEVTHGTFTADAMLEAKFGGTGIAGDDHDSVSGKISDFMDGSTDLGFADLKLGKAAINTSDADDAGKISSDRGLTAETDGGGTSGNWEGRFYGNANPDADGENMPADDVPTDVSGEFTGHFINGDVVGAFGAVMDK